MSTALPGRTCCGPSRQKLELPGTLLAVEKEVAQGSWAVKLNAMDALPARVRVAVRDSSRVVHPLGLIHPLPQEAAESAGL